MNAVANAAPEMIAIGSDSQLDTSGSGTCPDEYRVGCPDHSDQCKCLERRHSDHKLLVWGVKRHLKPPRNKRPDQFRWKLGNLLSDKEKNADSTQTGVDRQVLAIAHLVVDAPSMTTAWLEAELSWKPLPLHQVLRKLRCLVKGG